jgi:hypothetical protein
VPEADAHGRQAKYGKVAVIRVSYTSCYRRNKRDKLDLEFILASARYGVVEDVRVIRIRVESSVKPFRTILSKS